MKMEYMERFQAKQKEQLANKLAELRRDKDEKTKQLKNEQAEYRQKAANKEAHEKKKEELRKKIASAQEGGFSGLLKYEIRSHKGLALASAVSSTIALLFAVYFAIGTIEVFIEGKQNSFAIGLFGCLMTLGGVLGLSVFAQPLIKWVKRAQTMEKSSKRDLTLYTNELRELERQDSVYAAYDRKHVEARQEQLQRAIEAEQAKYDVLVKEEMERCDSRIKQEQEWCDTKVQAAYNYFLNHYQQQMESQQGPVNWLVSNMMEAISAAPHGSSNLRTRITFTCQMGEKGITMSGKDHLDADVFKEPLYYDYFAAMQATVSNEFEQAGAAIAASEIASHYLQIGCTEARYNDIVTVTVENLSEHAFDLVYDGISSL